MLDEEAWLTFGAPVHPKDVGWGVKWENPIFTDPASLTEMDGLIQIIAIKLELLFSKISVHAALRFLLQPQTKSTQ